MKRGHGEGSISRRANGTWLAQVTISGRRLSKTFKKRGDAAKWIREITGQVESGLTIKGSRAVFDQFVQEWLKSIQGVLKEKTWLQYVQVSNDYIIPSLGKIKLKDVRPEHIQQLYNSMDKGPYTVIKTHAILHKALEQARRTGLLINNPASDVIVPSAPKEEMNIWSQEESIQFLSSCQEHRWETLFRVALTTGMRQMELLGLMWKDLEGRDLNVRRQLVRAKSVTFAQPKTEFGSRIVALGEKTYKMVQDYREKQNLWREFADKKWRDHDLIFTNYKGGPVDNRRLRDEFRILIEKAEVPRIRFHDLRHTSIALMLNHGVPLIVVSRRVGHSKPSITLDMYGHLIPHMQAGAADLMDDLMEGEK